jgi:two-component system, OmpR family, phosphate regulon sensor histidine kinase PhoR
MMAQPAEPIRLWITFVPVVAVVSAAAWLPISPIARAAVAAAAVLACWSLVRRALRRSVADFAGEIRSLSAEGKRQRLAERDRGELSPLADSVNLLLHERDEEIGVIQTQVNEQQAVLGSMSNGLIALDLDQRILSLNRAAERMLGLYRAPVRGRLLQEVVRQPGLNSFVNEALSSPSRTTGEFELSSDPELLILATSEPLQDSDDRPGGLLILLTDITQIRRLETLRSDFAANVSHELRTPITNIKGYVETLLDVGVQDDVQTRKFLEVIRVNADRLATIIEDLLALARLEQPEARESLNPLPTHVFKMVEAAIAQLDAEAHARRIDLSVKVPLDLLVCVNPHLVEQAIANLVSNAIKYCPAGTAVEISARPGDGSMIEIAVRDEGPGIASQHLARIFERFYRVDRARSREQGGTGLGLAIVKHIALVHGGRVEVESKVGRGSTFRLLLPRGDDDPSSTQPESPT